MYKWEQILKIKIDRVGYEQQVVRSELGAQKQDLENVPLH